jgi:predicted DNA binding protein
VPAEDFALGRTFRDTDGVRFELERLVPTTGAIVPFFWIRDDDYEAIATDLRANDGTDGVRVVDELDGQALFRVEWGTGIGGLVRSLLDLDVAVLEAEGTAGRWEFEFRFPDGETLSEFQAACADADIDLDVRRVYDLTERGERTSSNEARLTPAQREVVVAALDRGYFAIPRETNLVEIAEDLGVSDQAVGERMRRATAKLARSSVIADPDPDFDSDPDAGPESEPGVGNGES